jgi:hypothetical protein
MSKIYWIESGRVKFKDGSSTSTVGDSDAVHVSHGEYNGKEALVIVYSDGKVKKYDGVEILGNIIFYKSFSVIIY